MPIFDINNATFFFTYSDIEKIGLRDKLFDHYNEDFEQSDIQLISNYVRKKNTEEQYPALFDFSGEEAKYAASELLHYATFKIRKNPSVEYLLNSGDHLKKGEDYFLYPFKDDAEITPNLAGINLVDKYLKVTARIGSVKRVAGCTSYTVIDMDNFHIYIVRGQISINLDPFRSFPNVDFRCQGKLSIPSVMSFKKYKWQIYIDRNFI